MWIEEGETLHPAGGVQVTHDQLHARREATWRLLAARWVRQEVFARAGWSWLQERARALVASSMAELARLERDHAQAHLDEASIAGSL
jgi:hypothetical protein